ncbi:MAG: prepilin-type N-terminal cleavage/methylation domain-containing protein, partial [Alphaproteobacteria bacterium]
MTDYKKTKKIKTQAFSLIELSIVILIIGILVAGVTQSSRLVNQFRLTSARNITLSSPLP